MLRIIREGLACKLFMFYYLGSYVLMILCYDYPDVLSFSLFEYDVYIILYSFVFL